MATKPIPERHPIFLHHGNNFSFAFVGRGLNFGITIFLDCILAVDISPLNVAHWIKAILLKPVLFRVLFQAF